jgi:hypothetical protein
VGLSITAVSDMISDRHMTRMTEDLLILILPIALKFDYFIPV